MQRLKHLTKVLYLGASLCGPGCATHQRPQPMAEAAPIVVAVAIMDKTMAERAAAEHVSNAELCDHIRYNPEIVASSVVFSVIRPDIEQLLMDQ